MDVERDQSKENDKDEQEGSGVCASSGVVVSMVKAAKNAANKRYLAIGASGGIGTLVLF